MIFIGRECFVVHCFNVPSESPISVSLSLSLNCERNLPLDILKILQRLTC